jgi:hypothetical protein
VDDTTASNGAPHFAWTHHDAFKKIIAAPSAENGVCDDGAEETLTYRESVDATSSSVVNSCVSVVEPVEEGGADVVLVGASRCNGGEVVYVGNGPLEVDEEMPSRAVVVAINLTSAEAACGPRSFSVNSTRASFPTPLP